MITIKLPRTPEGFKWPSTEKLPGWYGKTYRTLRGSWYLRGDKWFWIKDEDSGRITGDAPEIYVDRSV